MAPGSQYLRNLLIGRVATPASRDLHGDICLQYHLLRYLGIECETVPARLCVVRKMCTAMDKQPTYIHEYPRLRNTTPWCRWALQGRQAHQSAMQQLFCQDCSPSIGQYVFSIILSMVSGP